MLVALNYADKHFEGTVIDFDIEEECHVELGR
jgi:hypothetical protein